MARLSADEATILAMFSYMRPQGTPTEQIFVDRFLTPLGFKRDTYRNLVLTIGSRPILFSSHVDTVHREEGVQTLHYSDGTLSLSRKSREGKSNCLGADDTAGIWLMTEMVKAGVEGTYVVHFGEESGCIGSSDLARGEPVWLSQFKAAVAFDRAGEGDVITHQMGKRTCSDTFAQALSNQLGGKYKPDDGGAYTDTNEYAHLIPECTNISVGYKGQHGRDERQDVPFLIGLRTALLNVDWTNLPIERDPSVDDYDDFGSYYRGSYNSGGYGGRRSYDYSHASSMLELVETYPEVIADVLESYGISRVEVMDAVAGYYGTPSAA